MKVDLHVHTMERSSCAHASEDEQLAAAAAAGLEALFITDHWKLVPPEHLAELNRRYAPLRVFPGIEISVEGEDLLVLGVHDRRLEADGWKYAGLHAFVRSLGGFLVLAHPFRYHNTMMLPLGKLPVDAIEVYSPNTPPAAEQVIREMSGRFGIPLLSDSDAHVTRHIGSFYNILPDVPDGLPGIFDLLRSGAHRLYRR